MAEAKGDRLVKSVFALLTSSTTGAILGLVFWAVAAHLYEAQYVGYGAAAIAAMTGLASVAQLNLSVILPRFLYSAGARATTVLVAGYAATALLAAAVGVAFLTLTGHHQYIARGAFAFLFFLAAVILWVVFTIEDAALIGLRASFWVPVENTAFSIMKIALLPVFAILVPASGVFLSWTVPVVACIIPINYYLFRKLLPAHVASSAGRGSLPPRRVFGSVLGGEYVGGLAFVALNVVPALLIVAKLGAVQTAYFQAPWLIGTSFDFLLFNIATSLIVEASARPLEAAELVPRAVRLAGLILIPGCIVLFLGAPLILSVLGHGYAAHGATLLRWLALALPFMGVNVLYLTFARMGRRVRRIVAMQLGLSLVILSLIEILIGSLGITGAGIAFFVGQSLMACIVLPSVIRQYRRAGMAPGFAPGGTLVIRDAELEDLHQHPAEGTERHADASDGGAP